MKKLIFIVIVMTAFNSNAQQKIERLYSTTSLLYTGEKTWSIPSVGVGFGLTANCKSKFATSLGYSHWQITEKHQGGDKFFEGSNINSKYNSFHALFGWYKNLSSRIRIQLLAGPSYYRVDKAYNFTVAGKTEIGSTIWDYDRQMKNGAGLMLSCEGLIHFARVTGLVVGMDAHIATLTTKMNFRIGLPIGYFQKLKHAAE